MNITIASAPSRRGKRPISDVQRFEAKVLPEPNSGCWLWDSTVKVTGTNNSQLRGMFSLDGKVQKASRVSWRLYCGEIPDGREVCHRCDVPLCVNPEHLFLGTHAENMADAGRKKRMHRIAGEAHHNARLSADDAAHIRNSTDGAGNLARRYGVHRTTIHRVRTGKLWEAVS